MFVGKIQAQQKFVQFDIVTGDPEIRRIANYNLRPRKRKNLVEHKGQTKKLILTDTSKGKLTKGIRLIHILLE